MATIAVVEDDPDLCMLLEFKLRTAGHHVSVESDGEAGLAMIRRIRPDIVLLDWMMPQMSGLDVCRAVREDQSLVQIPIIFLTAKAQEQDVVAGLHAGADDYVLKPVSPRGLLTRIETRLASGR